EHARQTRIATRAGDEDAATGPGDHRLAARDLGLEDTGRLRDAARGGRRAWKLDLRSDRRRAGRIDTAYENALGSAAELAPRDEHAPARVGDDVGTDVGSA